MANVIEEYPEQRADGVYWVQHWDDGRWTEQKVNSGGGQAAQPAAPAFDWAGLWEAQADTNQQQFDWDKQRTQQALYADLAQALLSGAASLRGPRDWLKYAQYTNGGQDIFNRLFGSAAAPSFSGPSGFSEPVTVGSVLGDLGLSGTAGATGGGAGISDADIQAWAQGLNDPVAFERGREFVDRYGRLPQSIAEWDAFKNGTTAQATQGTGQTDLAGQPDPAFAAATAPVTGTTSTAGQAAQVPLPHQINPAVWDSLSQTAKQMILASAEEGNTPSGAWDATDFLSQLNAARPVGQAPKRTQFNWGNPQSLF